MCAESSLKDRIRSELPADAFRNEPLRVLWFIPLIASIVLLSAWLTLQPPRWYLAFLLALLLGHQYGSLFFFGHELSHGSMIRAGRLQDALLAVSYLIYCIPPRFNRAWHFTGHHAHTNVARLDTDTYGLIDEFLDAGRTTYIFRFTPGPGRVWSVFYLFTFSFQAQVLLWFRVKGAQFPGYSQRRAIVESLAMMVFWAVGCVALGPSRALFAVVIPMLVANLTVLSYGATNHGLRPLTTKGDPLTGSMSVRTLKVFDLLHFNFSHHVEHHMFPALSSRYTPIVRQLLRRHAADLYLAPPHWKALVTVFLTPRMYGRPDVLVNPYTGRQVPIPMVESALRAPGLGGLHQLWRTRASRKPYRDPREGVAHEHLAGRDLGARDELRPFHHQQR